ncbi:glutamate racemase [Undibacterium cyanobacteriorum]|uniref:Glutamate racemase n=1 Tax=Undibacterium cyanobacteriorum TaxID=3073561 RepID=A0ABY9RNY7_9BURK|nr:glutamate racemase [Undibacterium sp. 20NA77.5]WMW82152.1 glutamate racemase [Undibacterium sp. 20NA77.5]
MHKLDSHSQGVNHVANFSVPLSAHAPVGVFDSGIGGLSVVHHLREQLPHEDFIYFADSAYAPYGERSNEELIARSIKITEFLLAKGIKALIIACNTATAAAVAELRQRFPHFIIIGMEPGIKPAAARSESKVVGVLATRSTLQSQKFQELSARLSLETQTQFIPQACVGLVNEIERGDLSSPAITGLLRQYVTPLLEQGVDTLVLGCTHYPFVEQQIRSIIAEYSAEQDGNQNNKEIFVVDTGAAIARRLQQLLAQHGLLKPAIDAESPSEDKKQAAALEVWTTGTENTLRIALGYIKEESVPVQVCHLPT